MRDSKIEWELIAGIAIVVFLLLCFILPAWHDPIIIDPDEVIEIHTIIVGPKLK